jgi:hypothetical protein
MKIFEISSKKNKNGRRKFKAILYKIFPDSCVDEVNEVGTEFNKNGITWIKEYCEKALPSIKGMSLRCEFIDDERTELYGHGETGINDGEPVFEDAVTIGFFTKGYIEEIETKNGTETFCIGEGEIDAQCYNNFVTKLDEDIANGYYPSGSVEIMHTEDNESIVYKYGYKNEGRIPMEFIHSGYALLGIMPADDSAKLVELNKKHKEESNDMDTNVDIKAIVVQTVEELSGHNSEINQIKADCEAKIAEANATVETVTNEKNEIQASADQIQKALDEAKEELGKKYEELDNLYSELEKLREALAEAEAKERINELNEALAGFSDEEKECVKAEIEAFNADPKAVEINTITDKIWGEIGKKAKADAEAEAQRQVEAELNAAKANNYDDIFSGVEPAAASSDDIDIF